MKPDLRLLALLLAACRNDSSSVVDAPAVDAVAVDASRVDDVDAATPIVQPLGTLTQGPVVVCPAGAPPAATCRRISVACPGIPDLGGVIAVSSPTAPVATVVTIFGGTGTRFFDEGFPMGYIAKGLRVVQMQFDGMSPNGGWTAAGGSGLKAAACRPATVIQWAFDNVHGQNRSQGFCAHGHSGGSGAVSFAVAHYGLADILDLVVVDAGPVFGRVDHGCEPSLAGTGEPTRPVCPEIPAGPFAYSSGNPKIVVDTAEATTTCAPPYADSSATDQAAWTRDSVVSLGADYDYPQSKLSFWFCGNNPNEASGQGSYFVEQVVSERDVTCVTGSCAVEPPWSDPTAKQAMIDAMGNDCIPRHQ